MKKSLWGFEIIYGTKYTALGEEFCIYIDYIYIGYLDGNRQQVQISKLENIFNLNTTKNTKAEYIVMSIQSIFSQE